METEAIANRIKILRKYLNLNQEDFSNSLALSGQSEVSKIEAGTKRITAELLVQLRAAFDVDVRWVLFGLHPNSSYNDEIPSFEMSSKQSKKAQKF